jgi:predicted small lipoprotein YifL
MRVIMVAVVVLVLSGLSACGRKGELMPPAGSRYPYPSTYAEPTDAQTATP